MGPEVATPEVLAAEWSASLERVGGYLVNGLRGLKVLIALSIIPLVGCTSTEAPVTPTPGPSPSMSIPQNEPTSYANEPLRCPEDRDSLPRLTVADVRGVTSEETFICIDRENEPAPYTLPPSWDVLFPVDGVTLPATVVLTEGARPTRCTELPDPMVVLFGDTWFSVRQTSCPQLL